MDSQQSFGLLMKRKASVELILPKIDPLIDIMDA
jgi:hypothetical protein